jgi:tetratricopeptide (TPR) repeat protein
MSLEWNRRVIPVWRSSFLSSKLSESKSISNCSLRKAFDSQSLEKSLDLWRKEKSVGATADILNFAHINEFQEKLVEPASFIIKNKELFPLSLQGLAESIVSGSSKLVGRNQVPFFFGNYDIYRNEAALIKKRLVLNPRNSVALIDLARLYAAQGQKEQANRVVIQALSLNPHHRFILRSAARFLVHAGEPEKAAYYIGRAKTLATDPWLLATHVSLEMILDRSPRLSKRSTELVKADAFPPQHLTELASSLATLAAFNGEIKSAKKLFNKALVNPNDNSLAQAFWSTEKFGITLNIDERLLATPFTHEANYYHQIINADLEHAINEATDWYLDEPYSVRPLRAAAYIACVIGDYDGAVRFSEQALKIDNSNDVELLNNRIYALAARNDIEEAVKRIIEVAKIERSETGGNSAHTLANWGMINFKAGYFEEGEKYYKLAIGQFERERNYFSMAQAAAFMVRESNNSDNPNTPRLFEEARGIIKKYPSKMAMKILDTPVLKRQSLHSTLLETQTEVIKVDYFNKIEGYDPDKNILLIK